MNQPNIVAKMTITIFDNQTANLDYPQDIAVTFLLLQNIFLILAQELKNKYDIKIKTTPIVIPTMKDVVKIAKFDPKKN